MQISPANEAAVKPAALPQFRRSRGSASGFIVNCRVVSVDVNPEG
jgi:hypothetical protein